SPPRRRPTTRTSTTRATTRDPRRAGPRAPLPERRELAERRASPGPGRRNAAAAVAGVVGAVAARALPEPRGPSRPPGALHRGRPRAPNPAGSRRFLRPSRPPVAASPRHPTRAERTHPGRPRRWPAPLVKLPRVLRTASVAAGLVLLAGCKPAPHPVER